MLLSQDSSFEPLYPCVGLRTTGEEVEVNFGLKPFDFDIEGLRMELQEKARNMVEAVSLTREPQWRASVDQLVVSYLAHHG